MKTDEFLGRIQKILEAIGSPEDPLDELSRQILLHVSEQHSIGKKIIVSDVVTTFGRSSTPPTLYARIKKLRESGLLNTVPDPADKRAYQLFPTPLAQKQLKNVALKIRRAAGATA